MYTDVVTRRILLTIAVVPLIVLVGLRSAWAAYACSMDGKVRDACCCPQDKKKTDSERGVDGVPRIVAPDCCALTLGESSTVPDAREADRLRTAELSMMAITPATIVAPLVHATLRPTRTTLARPPPPAVPTYLANRSILR